MFNQFTALFQASLKPMNELVELNISTANTVAHQQGQFIAGFIDDSISFSQKMSENSEITNFIAEQSKFNADVQNKLTEAIKQTSGTLTKAKNDAEIILSDSFSVTSTKTSTEAQSVVPKMLIKEKPAPKAKAKAAPKAAPKAEVKAAPKAEVKAAPKAKAKAAPKAEVTAAPKAEVKAAPKAEVTAAPKAEVKAAPKAEVTAAPKAEVTAAPKAEVKAAPKAEVELLLKK